MPPSPRSRYRAFPMPQTAPACFLPQVTSILTSNTLFAHYIDEETEAQGCEVTCPKSQSCNSTIYAFGGRGCLESLKEDASVLRPSVTLSGCTVCSTLPWQPASGREQFCLHWLRLHPPLPPPTCPHWCQDALPGLECPPRRTEPCPILKGLSLKAFT